MRAFKKIILITGHFQTYDNRLTPAVSLIRIKNYSERLFAFS